MYSLSLCCEEMVSIKLVVPPAFSSDSIRFNVELFLWETKIDSRG